MAKKKADHAPYQRLRAAIRAGLPGRCYILHGEEGYLRETCLEEMKKKLLSGPAESFNFHRFNRETLDWDAVATAVEMFPMMAERTVVEVDDIDLYKEPEDAREKLVAILSDLPPHCCLIFHQDAVPFAPDKRMKKLHAAVENAAEIVAFHKQSDEELKTWIYSHAKGGGKEMDRDAVERLIFLTDSSLAAINSELQKLTVFAAGPSITREDVDAVVEPTLSAAAFDISNAIVDGDYGQALQKLQERLSMQEDPILLLGNIAAQIRKLQCARVLTDHGQGNSELMRLCGMSEYPARLTMNAARGLSRRFCTQAVLLCLETDRRLKSSYDEPRRLLELLLIRLAAEARR